MTRFSPWTYASRSGCAVAAASRSRSAVERVVRHGGRTGRPLPRESDGSVRFAAPARAHGEEHVMARASPIGSRSSPAPDPGSARATAHRFADGGRARSRPSTSPPTPPRRPRPRSRSGGGTARAYGVDVSDPAVGRAPRSTQVAADLGRPQVLVNCAGIGGVRAHERRDARALVRDHRRQPHRHVPHVPGRAAAPARRRRRDRERRVERRAHGPALLGRVLRVEGRGRQPHPGARASSTSSAACG